MSNITDTEDVPAGNTQEPEVNGIGIHEMEVNEIENDNKAEIQKLVSQALESKLTGFQTQMQQMMALLQNATGAAGTKEKDSMGGDKQNTDVVNTKKENDEEDVTISSLEPRLSVLKIPNQEKEDITGNSALELAHIAKWESVINKVCTILDIDADPVDITRSSTDNQYVNEMTANMASVQLPADGLLLKCWKKESVDMTMSTPISQLERCKYVWPVADQKLIGYFCKPESGVFEYLRDLRKVRQVLPSHLTKFHGVLVMGDQTLRYQQKAISYATYFLAALGRCINGEQEVENETVEEIMRSLVQCLMDICDMSIRASAIFLCSRRRLYLDRMNVRNRKAYLEFLTLPPDKNMFGGQLEPILKKNNLPIKPVSNKAAGAQSQNGVSQRQGGKNQGEKGTGQSGGSRKTGGRNNRRSKRRYVKSNGDIQSPNVKRQKTLNQTAGQ